MVRSPQYVTVVRVRTPAEGGHGVLTTACNDRAAPL